MKKLFIVTVNELHRRKYAMLAETEKEAGELALDGQAVMVEGSDEFIETTDIHRIELKG